MPSRYYSTTLTDFLAQRINLYGVDAALAGEVYHREYALLATKDETFIDVEWDTQNKRAALTYTTSEKLDSVNVASAYDLGPHRSSIKPGRLFARIVGGDGGGFAMDTLVQALNAFVATMHGAQDRIHVIRGDLIGKWYDNRMYCRCGYHGGLDSCMSHVGYDDVGQFELYKNNAEMVVVLCGDCGYLQSRAILWTDRTTNKKFVDRIYGNDINTKVIQQWASERGHTYVFGRTTQCSIQLDGIAEYIYDRTPYLDSIQLCDSCNHGYFDWTYHYNNCHEHAFEIERPTMTWDHDKDYGPVHEKCACGRMLYVDPEDNNDGDTHGHRLICSEAAYCRNCGEYHCDAGTERCYSTCDECGARHRDGEDCPNENYCGMCDEYYHGGECPNEYECDECGASYHDGDECPNIYPCNECGACYHDGDECPDCEEEEAETSLESNAHATE